MILICDIIKTLIDIHTGVWYENNQIYTYIHCSFSCNKFPPDTCSRRYKSFMHRLSCLFNCWLGVVMKIKIPFTNKQVILDPLYEGLFFMFCIFSIGYMFSFFQYVTQHFQSLYLKWIIQSSDIYFVRNRTHFQFTIVY